ncbi:glycosyltransferase family 4 protein [Alteraurantiacibacter buctensis]|uniref:Glycosyltransferase n=1 Tax=Alteraurantiacibacter buctensis TaxID=1503981 RepID=A0A844Z0W8_9SPHN|nr:glycosyltransferase family 1 protein [Alteraurantiacibacter buctensis]MXO72906.1 glycosyltransferase [Alteraurantiacibacter buctensis]
MEIAGLRIALFSGNYNMTTDGANRALNRLVEYLQRHGATVRVYSPVNDRPAFAPQGTLVPVPSLPIPGRSEYRMPLPLPDAALADMARFDPHLVHISSPDFAAWSALKWARARGLPVLASVHTRFDTYPRYYRMGFLEGPLKAITRKVYSRCDALVTPSESMAEVLREERMNEDIGIWSRGVDRTIFSADRRSLEWRRSLGIADGEVAVGFLGRLVMEKGLDVFGACVAELARRGVAHRVLVVGEGPARDAFAQLVPGAVFAGFQSGTDLGRAVASMDVLLNPSVTETFGNVTLEAMACGVPVVAARATGSTSLVLDGETGRLVPPGDATAFADAVAAYVADPALRQAHGAAGEARSRGYSWDAINGAMAEVYLRLVNRRRGSA